MTALVGRTFLTSFAVVLAALASARAPRGQASAAITPRTCDVSALGAAVAIDTGKMTRSRARFPSVESTEGAVITSYSEATKIKALVLTFFGEQGRVVSTYYIAGPGDFVLVQEELRYAAPISLEQRPRVVSRLPEVAYWCGGKRLHQLPDGSIADAKRTLDSALVVVRGATN